VVTFTNYFSTNNDLDSNIFDEILDALTLLALHLVLFNKYDIANIIQELLLKCCFRVAKFDEDDFSAPRTVNTIMMIGLFRLTGTWNQLQQKRLN
jgi:hypothetical protein